MSLTVYDLVLVGVVAFGILWGTEKGLLGIIKPAISFIAAKMVSGIVKNAISIDVAAKANQYTADKLGQLSQTEVAMRGTEMFADGIATIAAFIATYVIVRLILNIVLGTIRPKTGVTFKLDRFLGACTGAVCAVFAIVIVTYAASTLGSVGFTTAGEVARGISTSFITAKIMTAMAAIM